MSEYISSYYKRLFVNKKQRFSGLYEYFSRFGWNHEHYPEIPSEFLLKYIFKNWNFWTISQNRYFDLTIVEKHPEKDWDFRCFHENLNFNWEFFRKFSNRNWKFEEIVQKPDFPLEFIDIVRDRCDIFGYLCQKLDLSLKILIKYENEWNYKSLSHNPTIPLEFIERNFHRPGWEIKHGLSYNLNLTPEFILTHRHLSWNKRIICVNHVEHLRELSDIL